MYHFGLAVAILMTLMVGQSHAQTENNLLRGLSKIDVWIAKRSTGGTKCGLTEDDLRQAVMFPLSSSNIEVVRLGPSAVPVLMAKVTTSYDEKIDLCFSAVSLIAISFQRVVLGFSGEEKLADVTLWEEGLIHYSPRAIHRQRILEDIERQTKAFLTAWNLDNKTQAGGPR